MYSPGAGPWLDDYVDVFAATWKMPVISQIFCAMKDGSTCTLW